MALNIIDCVSLAWNGIVQWPERRFETCSFTQVCQCLLDETLKAGADKRQ